PGYPDVPRGRERGFQVEQAGFFYRSCGGRGGARGAGEIKGGRNLFWGGGPPFPSRPRGRFPTNAGKATPPHHDGAGMATTPLRAGTPLFPRSVATPVAKLRRRRCAGVPSTELAP